MKGRHHIGQASVRNPRLRARVMEVMLFSGLLFTAVYPYFDSAQRRSIHGLGPGKMIRNGFPGAALYLTLRR
jgi:hypothetical protein